MSPFAVAMIIYAITLIVCLAFLFNEGLWGNFLTLVNITLAALIAVNVFEPLAGWLESQWRKGAMFVDFTALWVVFIVCFLIFRSMTDLISRMKVKFWKWLDILGSLSVQFMIANAFFAIFSYSLHVGPVQVSFPRLGPADALGGVADGLAYNFFRYESFYPMSSFFSDHELDPETRNQQIQKYYDRRKRYAENPGVFAY